MTEPYQLRLVVHRGPENYAAQWLPPDAQPSELFPLALPLTGDDAERLRWYLETYLQFPGAGDHARARAVEGQLVSWGHALFGALFGTPEGTHAYSNLMNAADEGRPCTITIGATEPDILIQPWELMRDKRGPLAFQGVTTRRQLKGIDRPRRTKQSLPLRVLLIVSRPKDIGFIDPRNSIAPLLDAIDTLPPGQVELAQCDPPTIKRLEELISQARKDRRPYHIVHFDGHGTYLPLTGVGALAFEREDATTQLVSGAELGDMLARLDVPLVLLEACRGADLSDKPVFGSLAPALLDRGVGSVVAFSHSVHIKAAQLLVERFYRELTGGLTIGQALEEGRAALHADRRRWLHLGPDADSVELQDWFIPQLYQAGADPAFFKATKRKANGAQAPARQRAAVPLHGFPPEPMYRFQGRAQEQLELERAFRRSPAVLVSGMGGMGKTALAREAAAWWLRTGRFEAAVFHSFEQRAGAESVVQALGKALEGDAFSARPAEAQWADAVALFRSRRVLLVWDNFESTLPIYQEGEAGESILSFGADARSRLRDLYRELTAGDPQGRLLVTCRPDDTGLPGIKELPLGGLARPDSLYLVAAALERKGVASDQPGYERPEIDALLDMLDDHPLSIELVAPHLKSLTPAKICAEFGELVARFANEGASEGRNRSLLASLEFSKRRLSPAAQGALPYLAWFEGGVFEQFLLDFTQLTPEAWIAIRSELEATALIKVEELKQFNTPYLRFHPTLPYAAKASDVPEPEKAEQRFIALYLSVAWIATEALEGYQPAAGMILATHEEPNLRKAMHCVFRHGDRREGQLIADILNKYLQRSGRLRERDALASWVQEQTPQSSKLDAATCSTIQQYALSRSTQGHLSEAIEMVRDLAVRLEREGLADNQEASFQIATSYRTIAQIYVRANRGDLALEPANKAVALFEQLQGHAARSSLSNALGDLANAHRQLGQFVTALEFAERGLEIDRERGNNHSIAVALVQIARILLAQQRYVEADAKYSEALRAAHEASDWGLQGSILQHQGSLQTSIGNHDRAIELYKSAIKSFQRASNVSSEMRTCGLIATSEYGRGQLEAAEAWYARSRELALQLNDRAQLAAIAQNVGVLYQNRAAKEVDAKARLALQRQAIAKVKEGLSINLGLQDHLSTASSYALLGILHRTLDELDQAEEYALQALQIRESLNLPDVYIDYGSLADIARARGDEQAAAQWQAKHDAKLADLEKLRRGENTNGPSAAQLDQLRAFILRLAQAAYQARASKTALPPDAAENLAQLAGAEAPWSEVGAFLRAVAEGKPVPPVPMGLPQPIAKILEELAKAAGQV